jgi:hypothetical protein
LKLLKRFSAPFRASKSDAETFLLAAQAKRLILFVDATLWRAIKQEDEFYIPESNALFVCHNSHNGETPPAAATF